MLLAAYAPSGKHPVRWPVLNILTHPPEPAVQVATRKEVMIALSNDKMAQRDGMLGLWIENVSRRAQGRGTRAWHACATRATGPAATPPQRPPLQVLRAGVKNAMVLALDDETRAFAEGMGMRALRMDIKVRMAWCFPGGGRKGRGHLNRLPNQFFFTSAATQNHVHSTHCGAVSPERASGRMTRPRSSHCESHPRSLRLS